MGYRTHQLQSPVTATSMHLSVCKLEIVFRFGELRNEYMGVKITLPEAQSTLQPTEGTIYCYEQTITLPCTVHLDFFGKNINQDTEVDSNGNILRDKHVLLKELRLDNIPVEPLYLKRRLCLVNDQETVYSDYIGFNGRMSINLDQSNVFSQILLMKHLGES